MTPRTRRGTRAIVAALVFLLVALDTFAAAAEAPPTPIVIDAVYSLSFGPVPFVFEFSIAAGAPQSLQLNAACSSDAKYSSTISGDVTYEPIETTFEFVSAHNVASRYGATSWRGPLQICQPFLPYCFGFAVGLPGDTIRVTLSARPGAYFDADLSFVTPLNSNPCYMVQPNRTVAPLVSGVPSPVVANEVAVLMLPVGDRGAREMLVEFRPTVPRDAAAYRAWPGLDHTDKGDLDNAILGPPLWDSRLLPIVAFDGTPERMVVAIPACVVGAHALAPDAMMPVAVALWDVMNERVAGAVDGVFTLLEPTDITESEANVTVPTFGSDTQIFTFLPPVGTQRFHVEIVDIHDAEVQVRLGEDTIDLATIDAICNTTVDQQPWMSCRASQVCVVRRTTCSVTEELATTQSVEAPSFERAATSTRAAYATQPPSRWTVVVRAHSRYRHAPGRYTVRFVAEPESPASLLVLGAETHGSVAAGVYAHHRVHLTAADLAPYARLEVRVAMQQEDARPGATGHILGAYDETDFASAYWDVESYMPTVYLQYGRKAGALTDCFESQAACTDMQCILYVPYCLLGEGDWFISVINTFGGVNRPMQYTISANMVAPMVIRPGQAVRGVANEYGSAGGVEFVLETTEPGYLSAALVQQYTSVTGDGLVWSMAYNAPPALREMSTGMVAPCTASSSMCGVAFEGGLIGGQAFPAGLQFFTVYTDVFRGPFGPIDIGLHGQSSGGDQSVKSPASDRAFAHTIPFTFQVDYAPASAVPEMRLNEWTTLWVGARTAFFNATGLLQDFNWPVIDLRLAGREPEDDEFHAVSVWVSTPDAENSITLGFDHDTTSTISHPLRPIYFDRNNLFFVNAEQDMTNATTDQAQWTVNARFRLLQNTIIDQNTLHLDEIKEEQLYNNIGERSYIIQTDDLVLGDYTSLIIEFTVLSTGFVFYDNTVAGAQLYLTANMGGPLLKGSGRADDLTWFSCTTRRYCELRITRCVLSQPGPLFLSVEPLGNDVVNTRYTIQWRLDEPRPIAVSLAHGGGLADSLPPLSNVVPGQYYGDTDGVFNGHNRFYSFRTPAEVPAGTTMVLRLASIATSSATKGAETDPRSDDKQDMTSSDPQYRMHTLTSSDRYDANLNTFSSFPEFSWQQPTPSSSSSSSTIEQFKQFHPAGTFPTTPSTGSVPGSKSEGCDGDCVYTALLLSMTNEVDAPGVPPGPNSDVLFGADGCGATVPSWAYLLCTSKLSKESAACELRVPRDDFYPNATYYLSVVGVSGTQGEDSSFVDRLAYSLNVQFSRPSYATAELTLDNRTTISTTVGQIVDYYVDISAAPVGSVYEIQLEASTGTTLLVMAAVTGDAGDRARVNDYDQVVQFSFSAAHDPLAPRVRCNFNTNEAVPRCFMQVIKADETATHLWVAVESSDSQPATLGVIEVPIIPIPLDGTPTESFDLQVFESFHLPLPTANISFQPRFAYFSYDISSLSNILPIDDVYKPVPSYVFVNVVCPHTTKDSDYAVAYEIYEGLRPGVPAFPSTPHFTGTQYRIELLTKTLHYDNLHPEALQGTVGLTFLLLSDSVDYRCNVSAQLDIATAPLFVLDETPVRVSLVNNRTAFELIPPPGVEMAGDYENHPVINIYDVLVDPLLVCVFRSYEDSPRTESVRCLQNGPIHHISFYSGRKMRFIVVFSGIGEFTVRGMWQTATTVDLRTTTTLFYQNGTMDPFIPGNLNLLKFLLPTGPATTLLIFGTQSEDPGSNLFGVLESGMQISGHLAYSSSSSPDTVDLRFHRQTTRVLPASTANGVLYVTAVIDGVASMYEAGIYLSVESTVVPITNGGVMTLDLAPTTTVALSVPMPHTRVPRLYFETTSGQACYYTALDENFDCTTAVTIPGNDLKCDLVETSDAFVVWLIARELTTVTIQISIDASERTQLPANVVVPVDLIAYGGAPIVSHFVVDIPYNTKSWFVNGSQIGAADAVVTSGMDTWKTMCNYNNLVPIPTSPIAMEPLSSVFLWDDIPSLPIRYLYFYVTAQSPAQGSLTFVPTTYDVSLSEDGLLNVTDIHIYSGVQNTYRVAIPASLGQLGNFTVRTSARMGGVDVRVRLVADGDNLNYGIDGNVPFGGSDTMLSRTSGCPMMPDCEVTVEKPCTTAYALAYFPSNFNLYVFVMGQIHTQQEGYKGRYDENVADLEISFASIPLEPLALNEVHHVTDGQTHYFVIDVETTPSVGDLWPIATGFGKNTWWDSRYPIRTQCEYDFFVHERGRVYLTTWGRGSVVVYSTHFPSEYLYEYSLHQPYPFLREFTNAGLTPSVRPPPLRITSGVTYTLEVPHMLHGRTLAFSVAPGAYGRVRFSRSIQSTVYVECFPTCYPKRNLPTDFDTDRLFFSTLTFDSAFGPEFTVLVTADLSDSLHAGVLNATFEEIVPGVPGPASLVLGVGVHSVPLEGMLYAALDPTVFAPGDLVEIRVTQTPGSFNLYVVTDGGVEDPVYCVDNSMERQEGLFPDKNPDFFGTYDRQPSGTSCHLTLPVGAKSTGIILRAFDNAQDVVAMHATAKTYVRIVVLRQAFIPLERGVVHRVRTAPSRGHSHAAWDDLSSGTFYGNSDGGNSFWYDQESYYERHRDSDANFHRLFAFDVPEGALGVRVTVNGRQWLDGPILAIDHVPEMRSFGSGDDYTTFGYGGPIFNTHKADHMYQPYQHRFQSIIEKRNAKAGRYYVRVLASDSGSGYTVLFDYETPFIPTLQPSSTGNQYTVAPYGPGQSNAIVKMPFVPGGHYLFSSDATINSVTTRPTLHCASCGEDVRVYLTQIVAADLGYDKLEGVGQLALYAQLQVPTNSPIKNLNIVLQTLNVPPTVADITLGVPMTGVYQTTGQLFAVSQSVLQWFHFTVPPEAAAVGGTLQLFFEGAAWARCVIVIPSVVKPLELHPDACPSEYLLQVGLLGNGVMRDITNAFPLEMRVEYNVTFKFAAPINVSATPQLFDLPPNGVAAQDLTVPAGEATTLQLRSQNGAFAYGVYVAANPCGVPTFYAAKNPITTCAGLGACTVYLGPSSVPRRLTVQPLPISNTQSFVGLLPNRIAVKALTGTAKCQLSNAPTFCTDAPTSVVTHFETVANLDKRAALGMEFLLSDRTGFALNPDCYAALKTLYCLTYLPPCNATTGEEMPICSSLCDVAEAACGRAVLRLLDVQDAFCQLEARGECYPTAATAPPPAQAPVGAVVAATQGTSTSTVLAIVLGVVLSLLGLAGLGVVGVFVRRYQGRKHPAAHKAAHGEDSDAGSDDGALTPGGRVHPSAALTPSASHHASLARSGAVSSAAGPRHKARGPAGGQASGAGVAGVDADGASSAEASTAGANSSLGTSAWMSATGGNTSRGGAPGRPHSSARFGSGAGSIGPGYESDVVSSATSGAASAGMSSVGGRTRGMPRPEDWESFDQDEEGGAEEPEPVEEVPREEL